MKDITRDAYVYQTRTVAEGLKRASELFSARWVGAFRDSDEEVFTGLANIAAVNRTSVADEGDNSANDREMSTQDDERDRSRARRREYFLSYRSEVLGSETIVAGTFWSGRPARQEALR